MDCLQYFELTVDYDYPDRITEAEVPLDAPVRQSQWWKDYHRPLARAATCSVTVTLGPASSQALHELITTHRRQPTLEELVAILQGGQ